MAEQIIVRDSMQGYSPELALFDLPVQNTGVTKIQWVEYSPLNDYSQDGSLEFRVFGSGTQYLDLKRSLLYLKVKITQGDGSALPEIPPGTNVPSGANVGPINLFMHSMFRQVDIYLQDQLINSSETTYPYKAYMDVLLQKDQAAKSSELQAQLFYQDRFINETTDGEPITGTNYGLITRSLYFKQSREVDMEGPLLMNECQLDRYLLNGIKLGIKMFPSTDPFRLMSPNGDADFKVTITNATLKICCVTLSPSVLVAHQTTLEDDKKAFYPYQRAEIKKFAISQGSYSINVDDVYLGKVPSKLTVAMVSSQALSGSYSKNPLRFDPYMASYIGVSINGEHYPTKAIQPVFSDNPYAGNYVDLYLRTFHNKGNKTWHGINREDFRNGNTLFCFDFNPDLDSSNSATWPLLRKGNLRLEIHFSSPLPEAVTILVYGLFPSCLQVDKTRNVTFM